MIPAVPATSAVQSTYLWVGVGPTGQLATSNDAYGTTWQTKTSSFGTTNINYVASNGGTLYVAVGDSGTLASSPDGATWTQRTSSFSTSNVRSVAWGSDGYWVAVGDAGKLATSTDGTTWTQRTTGFSASNNVTGIAYGNGLWVAIDSTGAMRTATNPTSTWTARTSTLAQGTKGCLHYYKSGSVWIAGNDALATGSLASSTDGLTWTARNNSVQTQSLAAGGGVMTSNSSIAICIVCTSIGPPVAFGLSSTTDGTTYTTRGLAIDPGLAPSVASDQFNTLMATGLYIQTSSDGINWTQRASAPFQFYGLCHSSGTPSIR